ncbi:MAG: hypothetical protein JXA43_00370 [Candidatus Diapherotrites archaeon]|nr:hypothetical protein [Candidatus Diapherotrites archaeon]
MERLAIPKRKITSIKSLEKRYPLEIFLEPETLEEIQSKENFERIKDAIGEGELTLKPKKPYYIGFGYDPNFKRFDERVEMLLSRKYPPVVVEIRPTGSAEVNIKILTKGIKGKESTERFLELANVLEAELVSDEQVKEQISKLYENLLNNL